MYAESLTRKAEPPQPLLSETPEVMDDLTVVSVVYHFWEISVLIRILQGLYVVLYGQTQPLAVWD